MELAHSRSVARVGLVVLSVLTATSRAAFAVCAPDGTSGPDTIVCTGVDADGVAAGSADDTVTVASGALVEGSFAISLGSGADTAVNNGHLAPTSSNSIANSSGAEQLSMSDGGFGVAESFGNETITNNGTVTATFGIDGGFADDVITNNGLVESSADPGDITYTDGVTPIAFTATSVGIIGDFGNDTITNGVAGRILIDGIGIFAGPGNDTVTNSGVINAVLPVFMLNGDDTISLMSDSQTTGVGVAVQASGGDDVVNLHNSALVIGTIDGGANNAGGDTLNFMFTTTDCEEYNDFTVALNGQTPASGSIKFRGLTYTWVNFEHVNNMAPCVPPTTTTTLPPGSCGGPPAATFASLNCRLAALIAQVAGSTEIGAPQTKLGKQLAKAKERKDQAEGLCGQSNDRKTKKSLGKALRGVTQVGKTLGSRQARKSIPDALRQELISAVDAVRVDLGTLKGAVRCPDDVPPA